MYICIYITIHTDITVSFYIWYTYITIHTDITVSFYICLCRPCVCIVHVSVLIFGVSGVSYLCRVYPWVWCVCVCAVCAPCARAYVLCLLCMGLPCVGVLRVCIFMTSLIWPALCKSPVSLVDSEEMLLSTQYRVPDFNFSCCCDCISVNSVDACSCFIY